MHTKTRENKKLWISLHVFFSLVFIFYYYAISILQTQLFTSFFWMKPAFSVEKTTGIFHKPQSYAHWLIWMKSVILSVKGWWHMKQQELYRKTLQEQEERMQEMEHVISLLEEENSLQQQLVEKYKEENQMLQRHMKEYTELVHRMMQDFDE
jgi:TolA-binding protein